MSLLPVKIAGTGSFLPGPPVPNDRLEAVLGPLPDAPTKVKSFIENLGPKMLERGGVLVQYTYQIALGHVRGPRFFGLDKQSFNPGNLPPARA